MPPAFRYGRDPIHRGRTTQPCFREETERPARRAVSRTEEKHELTLVHGASDPRFSGPFRVLLLFNAGDVASHAQIENNRTDIGFAIDAHAHKKETEVT